MADSEKQLTVRDHSRDAVDMTYVYPVVSRRAGGVSVGINLNPNNACNWRCVYCQVPDLKRGGPPPIDLARLRSELDAMLDLILHGDFMQLRVPEGARRLMDVAFSGNGEPTSAAEFPEAVRLVADVLEQRGLKEGVRLRLITNGSLLDRTGVRDGIAALGQAGGEVWFKLDRGTRAGIAAVNDVSIEPATALKRLRACSALCPTWVQSCWFSMDGVPPGAAEQTAFVELLAAAVPSLAGVHLYSLARPSLQPEAPRLGALDEAWLEALARQLRDLGLKVVVSP